MTVFQAFEVLLLGRLVEALEHLDPGEDVGGREDQRVVGVVGVDRQERLLGALDRADVVDEVLDLGGDPRVVVEVDERLGLLLVRRALRDHHVVRPEHAALLGDRELEGLLVEGELDDVARPGHRHDDVARGEVGQVVVALDRADQLGVDRLLDLGERLVELVVGDRRRIEAEPDRRQADRVAHLREVVELALVLHVPERRRGCRARRSSRCRSRCRSSPTATGRSSSRPGRTSGPGRRPRGWSGSSSCPSCRSSRPSRAG